MHAGDRSHPWTHRQETPDRAALILAETGETLTYRSLMDRADRATNLLISMGCETGDSIALLSENNLVYPEICWAAKNAGLYYACVSTQLNAVDAAYVVTNSDAKILIVSGEMSALAIEVAQLISPHVRMLMFGGATPPFEAYEALRDVQSIEPQFKRRRGASMLYSSGTTGRPKGIKPDLLDLPPSTPPLRHRLLLEQFEFCAGMVFVNPGPFYHAAPLRKMMAVHREGGTVIAYRKFDATTLLRSIEYYHATHGFFVPTMFVKMLRLPAHVRDSVDTSSMRYAIHGAAPCPVELKEAMMRWWGPVLHELYGGTEGCGHTFITPQEWMRKKGSVGQAANGCSIVVVDEAGHTLGPNQTGLIFLGNGRAFRYHKDDEKTQAAQLDDGRFATMGDVGHLDDEGYLFLTDRQAHTIISGGVNIYPQEAENLLLTHPAVADAAVIGVPNEEFGEEVKAVVLPHAEVTDLESLATELIAYCRQGLSAIKCPRSVDFVSELPRNEAGKLLKRLIREPYWRGRNSRII